MPSGIGLPSSVTVPLTGTIIGPLGPQPLKARSIISNTAGTKPSPGVLEPDICCQFSGSSLLPAIMLGTLKIAQRQSVVANRQLSDRAESDGFTHKAYGAI